MPDVCDTDNDNFNLNKHFCLTQLLQCLCKYAILLFSLLQNRSLDHPLKETEIQKFLRFVAVNSRILSCCALVCNTVTNQSKRNNVSGNCSSRVLFCLYIHYSIQFTIDNQASNKKYLK